MTVNIPNWTSANLSDISLVVRGITFPASAKLNEWSTDRVCCLRTSNIQKKLDLRDVYFVDRSYVKREEQIVQPGDILMSMANSYELVGKVARADNLIYPSAFGAFLAAVRPTDVINGSYLFNFLKSSEAQRKLREGSSQTTNIANISASTLGKLEIPLPPLAEQRRIADKLDTTLARVDALNDRLARITPLLKRFRQSVLAAATSGKLTEDWRIERSPQPVIESELIRIRETAASSSKETRIIKDLIERSIYSLPKDGIPNEWLKTCIGMAGAVSNGSTPSRAVAEYWNGKISWVSSGEVRNNLILDTKEKISQFGFESSSVRLLPIGTVLIAMIGEGKTRGQSALLGIEATINQNIAAVVPLESLLIPKYLWYWFQSQYENNRQAGNGTGPQALNCQKVRELPLNLPPVIEQTEIVRRVETLFAFADRLEARLQSAQTAADRLTPALLAKAFRGELVPQAPSDEPAAELLRRLREARAADTPAKRGRGRKVAATYARGESTP